MKLLRRIISTCIALAISLQSVAFVQAAGGETAATNTITTTTEKFTYTDNKVYAPDLQNGELISAQVGYGSLRYDRNLQGKPISLMVDNKRTDFIKGILAHAPSTLIYKIDDLIAAGYTKFSCYAGLDANQGNNGDGVKFVFYLSKEGVSYDDIITTKTLKGNTNCEKIDIDFSNYPNYKYLKIDAKQNNNNACDHSALAMPTFYKPGYVPTENKYDFIKTVDAYTKEISSYGEGNALDVANSQSLRDLIYKREIVEKVGYDVLQSYANYKDSYKEGLKWLFEDSEALELYVNGGNPLNNNYFTSIRVLLDLYTAYKDDVLQGEDTKLYKTMFMALALTHCKDVTYWIYPYEVSDPLVRYDIYRHLYKNGLLFTDFFKQLTVEEMRWVVDSVQINDEIEWFNYYVRNVKYKDKVFNTVNSVHNQVSEYHFITYRFGYDYTKDQYYSDENKAKWQEKYHLVKNDDDKYRINVRYEKGYPRSWMVFEEGSVCGGLSKTGSNIFTSFGIPAAVIGQPAHAAYLKLRLRDADNPNSEGMWEIGNNVFGWQESQLGRSLLDFGTDRRDFENRWSVNYKGSYMILSQACLDDYTNYRTAEDYIRLGDMYRSDFEKAKIFYEHAINAQRLNMHAWGRLITLQKENNCDQAVIADLGKKMMDTFTFYPLAMYDMYKNQIEGYITDPTQSTTLKMLAEETLKKAKNATSADILQPDPCRQVANYILGNNNTWLAKFSFDGENAGKIIFNRDQAGTNEYLYSLDGGNKWTSAKLETSVQLTAEEISSITVENGIRVALQGVPDIHKNFYGINITEGSPVSGFYRNDNENRIIGPISRIEWSYDEEKWNSFDNVYTYFYDDTTVYIRNKASGTKLAGPSTPYSFTKSTDPETRSYVGLSGIMIEKYSSDDTQEGHGNPVTNAIDGSPYTNWHTLWSGTDKDRYISFQFTKAPIYLSGFDYTPRQSGNNGIFTKCELYTSMDGENWTLTASADWPNNNNKKSMTFEPVYTKYVKIVGANAVNGFGSASMMEFFENKKYSISDITAIEVTTRPNKVNYGLHENLDLTGIKVKATLKDGTTRDLIRHEYYVDKSDMKLESMGEKTITLRLYNNNVTTDFKVHVANELPTITTQPKTQVYIAGDKISPLGVEATISDNSPLTYQWYKSTDEMANADEDTLINNATDKVYTPDSTGYYYVAVKANTGGITYSDVASIMIGDFVATADNKGFDSIAEAVAAAKDGETVNVYKDSITNGNTITINKTVTIKSGTETPVSLKRNGNDKDRAMFAINSGELTLENIVIDGGAVWAGNDYAALDRPPTNIGTIASRPVISMGNSSVLNMNTGSVIQNNHSSSGYDNAGGAILAYNTAKININGGQIINNQCNSYGGAIMLKHNAHLNIGENSLIKGNSSSNSGVVVCADHSSIVNINGGTIKNNQGSTDGIIWLSNGQCNINDGSIINNSANNGGAVYVKNSGICNINGGTISGNTTNSNSSNGVYLGSSGTLNIAGFEAMDSVYLAANKTFNISGDLTGKTLPVVLAKAADSNTRYLNIATVSMSSYFDSAFRAIQTSSNEAVKGKGAKTIKSIYNQYDYDNNGEITEVDAGLVLRYSAGLNVNIPYDSTSNEDYYRYIVAMFRLSKSSFKDAVGIVDALKN